VESWIRICLPVQHMQKEAAVSSDGPVELVEDFGDPLDLGFDILRISDHNAENSCLVRHSAPVHQRVSPHVLHSHPSYEGRSSCARETAPYVRLVARSRWLDEMRQLAVPGEG